MHGQFVWYELTTPDAEAAKKFYPRFTGWGTQPFDKDYDMWTTGGVPFAGVFRLTQQMSRQGVPPNWMAYVEADDVDATVAKARSLGANVMAGPDQVPNVGRYAVLTDPQGAAFGVYKSVRESGSWDGTPVIGRMSWHELLTKDHNAAFDFYSSLFGWEKTGEMDMGDGNMYLLFGKGDKSYGGMFTRFGDMANMHPFWLMYINVKDVGTAVDIATKAGARVHRPQMDIPGGSIAILGDPQGAGFAVHHESTPAAAQPAAKTAARKSTPNARKSAPRKKAAAKKGARPASKAAAKKVTKKKAAKSASRSNGRANKKAASKKKKAAQPARSTRAGKKKAAKKR
jgi:predicted enzyme related to lactoylglutathione lyase